MEAPAERKGCLPTPAISCLSLPLVSIAIILRINATDAADIHKFTTPLSLLPALASEKALWPHGSDMLWIRRAATRTGLVRALAARRFPALSLEDYCELSFRLYRVVRLNNVPSYAKFNRAPHPLRQGSLAAFQIRNVRFAQRLRPLHRFAASLLGTAIKTLAGVLREYHVITPSLT